MRHNESCKGHGYGHASFLQYLAVKEALEKQGLTVMETGKTKHGLIVFQVYDPDCSSCMKTLRGRFK